MDGKTNIVMHYNEICLKETVCFGPRLARGAS
jgi:hypothetical protein